MRNTLLKSTIFLLLVVSSIPSIAMTETDSIPSGGKDSLTSADKWAFSVVFRTAMELKRVVDDQKEIIKQNELIIASQREEIAIREQDRLRIEAAYEADKAWRAELQKQNQELSLAVGRWKNISLTIGLAALTYVVVKEVVR